jgi:hypothetical protein
MALFYDIGPFLIVEVDAIFVNDTKLIQVFMPLIRNRPVGPQAGRFRIVFNQDQRMPPLLGHLARISFRLFTNPKKISGGCGIVISVMKYNRVIFIGNPTIA